MTQAAGQNNELDAWTVSVFVREVHYECGNAMIALQMMDRCIADMTAAREALTAHPDSASMPDFGRYIREVWYHCQAFLAAFANIAKLLDPSPTRQSEYPDFTRRRGEVVRAALPPNAIAPFLRDKSSSDPAPQFRPGRELRNHFEHYDERLDKWALESPHRILGSRNLGHPSDFGGVAEDEHLGLYDPSTGHLVFQGAHYDLTALAAAVKQLLAATTAIVGPHV